ncbi:MAG: response regulator [Candidatus Rokubacteria bacterium]|nr:response regulator [Candidatus Rokubacteria bacterium]
MDDEDRVRDLLTEHLLGLGYEPLAARSGNDAVESLKRQIPDLVLLDISMPGMNGVDVLTFLRSKHPEIPVVMISGLADEGLAHALLRLGAVAFVRKPFDLNELERLVAVALTGR